MANIPQIRIGNGLPPIGDDVDALVLVFSRDEVCGLRVGRAVDDLMGLSDDPRLANRLCGSVFFSFEGWDNDPREVHEAPEVRMYMRQIHNLWPYWMHFLACSPDMYGVLLMCLLDTHEHPVPLPNGKVARAFDKDEMAALLGQMTRAMNRLHDALGLDDKMRKIIEQQALGTIDQALLPAQ